MRLPQTQQFYKIFICWGAWLDQSVKYVTLDLGVVRLKTTLGVEVFKNKIF